LRKLIISYGNYLILINTLEVRMKNTKLNLAFGLLSICSTLSFGSQSGDKRTRPAESQEDSPQGQSLKLNKKHRNEAGKSVAVVSGAFPQYPASYRFAPQSAPSGPQQAAAAASSPAVASSSAVAKPLSPQQQQQRPQQQQQQQRHVLTANSIPAAPAPAAMSAAPVAPPSIADVIIAASSKAVSSLKWSNGNPVNIKDMKFCYGQKGEDALNRWLESFKKVATLPALLGDKAALLHWLNVHMQIRHEYKENIMRTIETLKRDADKMDNDLKVLEVFHPQIPALYAQRAAELKAETDKAYTDFMQAESSAQLPASSAAVAALSAIGLPKADAASVSVAPNVAAAASSAAVAPDANQK